MHRISKKNQITDSRIVRTLLAVVGVLVLIRWCVVPVVLWALRPPPTNLRTALFEGIVYDRIRLREARPVVIHLISIDLNKANVEFQGTKVLGGSIERSLPAQRTTTFLKNQKLDIAINASLFRPFYASNLLHYYPHEGDLVNVSGLGISNGVQYSEASPGWGVACFQGAKVTFDATQCRKEATIAVSGSGLIVHQGKSAYRTRQQANSEIPEPQSSLALTRDGVLLLVVVDGRQSGYSEGMTGAELAEFLLSRGATDALRLDGGGSTTLALRRGEKGIVLNSPIHVGIPMLERPVANHFGVRVLGN